MSARICVGIDQTGAVVGSGALVRPRPLPVAAILGGRGGRLRLVTGQLKELAWAELGPWLESEKEERVSPGQVCVLVDAVLGLPQGVAGPTEKLRGYLARAARWPGLGRSAAEDFFGSLLAEKGLAGEVPRRQVEVLAGANSVFRARPYQRNIQTGTYRVWKELGRDPGWFRLAHHEARQPTRALLAEGYPSLAWRLILGTQRREPEQCARLLAQAVEGLSIPMAALRRLMSDADACDAAVLAAQAFQWRQSRSPRWARVGAEGWIVGVRPGPVRRRS